MKQVLQSMLTGEISVAEVPAPAIQPGCLLVQTRSSALSVGTERATIERVRRGIAGTVLAQPELVKATLRQLAHEGLGPILEKIRTRLEEPVPLGYSAAGIVREVGAEVPEFRVGDPVACAGYGFASHAEILCVPKRLCVKIPENVSWEEASFTTLGAIAMQAIRVADVKVAETVSVVGLGMLGQLIAQIACAAGCKVFGIDPRPERVALAQESGMEAGMSNGEGSEEAARAGLAFTAHQGFDATFIAAASEDPGIVGLAAELTREHGCVIVVGNVPLEIPRQRFYEKELQLRLARSYGPGRYDPQVERHGIDYPLPYVRWTAERNMAAFLHLLASGKIRINPLVTHRCPLQEAPKLYAAITRPEGNPPLGAVLQYEGTLPAPPVTTASVEHPQSARPVPGTIGLGMIGAGRFARSQLLPALRRLSGVRILGVAAAHGVSARVAARRFRIPTPTTDYRTLLNEPGIHAILIATPHHLHAAMVCEALQSMRHVFVEKPLCLSREELNRVAAVYRPLESQLVLAVGFNRRFSPAAQMIREWFAKLGGPLTLVYRINASSALPQGWWSDPASSGGRILGEIGHFVDLAGFLTHSSPVQVWATSPRVKPGDPGEESVVANLAFADGSLATLVYLTGGDPSLPKERLEVFGGGSAAVLDDFASVMLHRNGRRKILRRFRQEKGFREELSAFVQAIQAAGPSPIPFDQLYSTTLATFRILESVQQGVSLPVSLTVDGAK